MKFDRFQNRVDHFFDSPRHADEKIDVRQMKPVILAFIGDAYFNLFIRMRLLDFERSSVRVLNEISNEIVSAKFQARAVEKIKSQLTEEEIDIIRRGRNAKTHSPKTSTIEEYHLSTGFEALIGSLYIEKKFERLDEICEISFQSLIGE